MLVAGAWLWRNAITVLSTVSAVFAAMTVDPNQTTISHEGYHYMLIAQMVLTVVLSQIKRDHRTSPKKAKKR